jgi:WhiB family transcriptional regulator, redox-sensing transcriptional regulator
MRPAPRALCANHPRPDLWFSYSALQKRAVAICKQCPLRERCLDHAVSRPEVHGVWGGTTAEDRRALVEAAGGTFKEPAEGHLDLRRTQAGELVEAR